MEGQASRGEMSGVLLYLVFFVFTFRPNYLLVSKKDSVFLYDIIFLLNKLTSSTQTINRCVLLNSSLFVFLDLHNIF
jgi:hypothetical protein